MVRHTPVATPVTDRHRVPARQTVEPDQASPSERATFVPARHSDREPRTDVPSSTPARPFVGVRQIELGPIIKAKIQAPALRTSILTRPRLIHRLATAVRSRLTLVIAEAGYGKTTLLADFAARSELRTMWYRLDSADADVVTWANHLVAAVRETEPTFGQATLSLMSQLATGGPPKSAFVSSVISELGDLDPRPTVLVLDDFHAVDEHQDAIDFVARLASHAPPWLSIVISSRRRPTLEVGRLTASGELVEVATDELRFSRDETVRLFAETYQMPLEDDVLYDVEQRTQGWVASLQLFHGSVRGRPPSAVRALARALSGATSPIYDFLAEEVLANLPTDIERFLVRSSLLERISADPVVALFSDAPQPPSPSIANEWIEEADRLALLSRSSDSSDARQLHPLLRDFLVGHLRQTESDNTIRDMHLRVARSIEETDPLSAAHHFLEAGDEAEAMRSLGASVMLTMGSGQWGVACDLVERIKGVPADPAVAAIRARRLTEEGDLEGAAALLAGVDVSDSAPDVRAVFRHALLSLGWRNGDREMMFATLAEIQADSETPAILRDIFQIFVDASPLASSVVPYATLARRMERMAKTELETGHTYYAAISLHNSALTMMAAARFSDAIRLGSEALTVFDRLPHVDTERYSTHAVLAICAYEQGDTQRAEEHIRVALSSGLERGDVHAECAFALSVVGERQRALQLLLSADELERQGRSDLTAQLITAFTRALVRIGDSPTDVAIDLRRIPPEMPLDTGYELERQLLIALAELLSGEADEAKATAESASDVAISKGAVRAVTRLRIVSAIAARDAEMARSAISAAAACGQMSLLFVAEAIASSLMLVPEVPDEVRHSIACWPNRWLPILRKQLDSGGTPNGAIAARLLDEFGDAGDVPKLRAFAKTYRRHMKGSSDTGRSLARRVAPTLVISDLGRTQITIGERQFELGQIRRKAAGLLMFLVTRPGHTATREQALEELWPNSDPDAASNNLNQSLYFLRREIDPWFEDDLSVDYVGFKGDVVWLDPGLSAVQSVKFATDARRLISERNGREALDSLRQYTGQFSPEFEYEEWAISWRARVHALFLELANTTISERSSDGDLESARDAALIALNQDPMANEIERKLIWLYWHLGSQSAAIAQHEHLTWAERSDGLDPTTLTDITHSSLHTI